MIYALIKNGTVDNMIVCDEHFISLIENQYDNCIQVDELEIKPGLGWLYGEESFINPELQIPLEEP